MVEKNIQLFRSDCPIGFSLDLIGDKWSLLIIRDMLFFDKSTYSDFLNSPEKIASNIARNRLVKLAANGFIIKSGNQARHWNRPYLLTEKALGLIPVIIDLALWGSKFHSSGMMEEIVLKAKKNRKKLISDVETKMRDKGIHQVVAD